jgi:hypothetical protein
MHSRRIFASSLMLIVTLAASLGGQGPAQTTANRPRIW